MQRFYQAVELDEAEMARKRNSSLEPTLNRKSKSMERTINNNEFESKNKVKIVSFGLLFNQFHLIEMILF